jgi:hypothetical protein
MDPRTKVCQSIVWHKSLKSRRLVSNTYFCYTLKRCFFEVK